MSGSLRWRTLDFAQLTPGELYRVLDLRVRVFVVEQTCPYRETDGLDLRALHLLGEEAEEAEEAGEAGEGSRPLVAYARLLAPGIAFPEPAIGRVVTCPSVRGRGYGRALMERALSEASSRWPGPVQIGAQRYLEAFYGSLGFRPVGEPYLEDGIPHVHMLRG